MNRTGAKASAWAFTLFVMASPLHAANLSLKVLTREGKTLPGAVITAEPQGARLPAPPPAKAIVDQVNLSFVPDVSVIPAGTTVAFPNSDGVSHQVYSFSPARRFQLPLYRGKQHPPVVFDQPGIITLGCNIHDNMVAYVVVTAAPFFGRTDAKGSWVVANVAEGVYRVQVWHPRLKNGATMVEQVVQLTGDGQEITVKLDQALRPAPLKGHPHSWDY